MKKFQQSDAECSVRRKLKLLFDDQYLFSHVIWSSKSKRYFNPIIKLANLNVIKTQLMKQL